MSFKGKNIVITGATSGIGLKLAEHFISKYDCNVCIVGRNRESLNKIKTLYGSKVFVIECDLRIKDEVDKFFNKLFTKGTDWDGLVDIFIANAGFGYYEKFDKGSWEHIEDIFLLNCISPLYALSKMQQYCFNKRFQFVITSSAIIYSSIAGYSLYSATKGALDCFCKAMQNEKNDNVTLSVVYPIAVNTPFYLKGKSSMNVPLMKQGIDICVKRIINGIRLEKKKIYTSYVLRIFLVLKKLLPLESIYNFIESIRFRNWDIKK